ncbi:MFS transporter [Caproicibacter fermentans]|nr:MFS transporter [Caproicibacter fermentans]
MRKQFEAYRMYLIFSCLYALFYSLNSTVTMVYQVEILHLSPLQLVLTGTAFEASCFLSQVPTGIVADLYSRKLSVILGVGLTGLGFLIQGSIPSYPAVMASQVFLGIGSTFIDGALEAWIADEDRAKGLNTVYLRGAQFGQIGALAGILLSTVLGNLSLVLPILLGGGLMLTLCLFLALSMPEVHFHPAAPEELNSFQKIGFTLRSGIKIIRTKTVLLLLLCMALFTGLASEGYDRLNTDHFLNDTTLPRLGNLKPVTWFGIFGILVMLLSTLVMQFAVKRKKASSSLGSVEQLSLINFFYLLSMLLFGITRNFSLMLLSYLTINTLKALNRPILSALLTNQIDRSVRATVLSTNEQVNSLGEILGGPLIGLLAEKFSVGFGISATVIFLIPVSLLLLIIRNRELKNPAEQT